MADLSSMSDEDLQRLLDKKRQAPKSVGELTDEELQARLPKKPLPSRQGNYDYDPSIVLPPKPLPVTGLSATSPTDPTRNFPPYTGLRNEPAPPPPVGQDEDLGTRRLNLPVGTPRAVAEDAMTRLASTLSFGTIEKLSAAINAARGKGTYAENLAQ